MCYLYNAYSNIIVVSDMSELVARGLNIMRTSHITLFTWHLMVREIDSNCNDNTSNIFP